MIQQKELHSEICYIWYPSTNDKVKTDQAGHCSFDINASRLRIQHHDFFRSFQNMDENINGQHSKKHT